jgi:hypothetical protein
VGPGVQNLPREAYLGGTPQMDFYGLFTKPSGFDFPETVKVSIESLPEIIGWQILPKGVGFYQKSMTVWIYS